MRQFFPLLGLALFFWASGEAFAHFAEPPAEKKAPPSAAETLAPYVDAQTLVVAHVDLNAFEPMKTIDWLTGILGLSPRDRDNIQSQAAPISVVTQGLPKGQSVSVYVVISLSDIGRLPFFLVLPLDDHTPAIPIATEARRELEKAWNRKVASDRVGDALVVGSPETIERLKKAKPVARPEIDAALSAVDEGAVQIALIPSPDMRRLAEALLPEAPKQLGGGPTKTFTQGAVWAALSIDLPPHKVEARLVIQSVDAAAAVALDRRLATAIDAIAALPSVRDGAPNFAEVARRLVPKPDGDQLKIVLDEEEGDVTAGLKLLGPLLRVILNAGGK
ncbi:MAG TPA: hypothetical protein VGJ26_13920 [Pirellulales bacterium]|jgi:hypothetical protein